jgi:hypothetical protein
MSGVEHAVCEWLKSFSSDEARACTSIAELSDGTILGIVASEMYDDTHQCLYDFDVVFAHIHPKSESQASITGCTS